MNIGEQRVALVTAVDAVTGVSCYERRPKSPRPGDAWVELESIDLLHGLVWSGLWHVVVMLPQGSMRAADEWLDDHFEDLVAAIRTPGFATAGGEVTSPTDVGEQLMLDITARSE